MCGRRATSAAAWPMPPWKPGTADGVSRCRTTASRAVPSEPATRWTTLIALVARGHLGRARRLVRGGHRRRDRAPSPARSRTARPRGRVAGVGADLRVGRVPARASSSPPGTTRARADAIGQPARRRHRQRPRRRPAARAAGRCRAATGRARAGSRAGAGSATPNSAMPSSRLVAAAAPKPRRRNRRTSISGGSARRAWQTKPGAPHRPTARPSDARGRSRPPLLPGLGQAVEQRDARGRAARAPRRSSGWRAAPRRAAAAARRAASAAAPTGRLTKKIQRQLAASRSAPPSTGPKIGAEQHAGRRRCSSPGPSAAGRRPGPGSSARPA